eukprot:GAHX01004580.1.p1 GENE.GAHX01004580.1~~GAHX01004580.1.p1  ORF type:complete len:543 (-),score=65.03 GAHX01004580.1:92-1720(-)
MNKCFTKKIGCKFILKFVYDKRNLECIYINGHCDHGNVSFRKKEVDESVQKTIDVLGGEQINLRRVMNMFPISLLNGNTYSDVYKLCREKKESVLEIKQNQYIIHRLLSDFEEIHAGENLLGIYFQDTHMKNLYSAYGETVFFDGTYNLFHTDFTLFILSVVNGEGKTEPVLIFSTQDETYQSMCVFFYKFILENDKNKVALCFTDKDWVERKIIKEAFPNCDMRLCVYHVMKTMAAKLNTVFRFNEKEEKEQQKSYFKKIIFSESEQIYTYYLQKLVPKVKQYFLKNWDKFKTEFITHQYVNKLCFNSRINNRAEAMNSILKNYFQRKREQSIFFVEYKQYLDRLRNETQCIFQRKYMKNKNSNTKNEIWCCLREELCLFSMRIIEENNCVYPDEPSKCKLYIRFGLVCSNCIHLNECTWSTLDKLINKRWKRSIYINTFNFKDLPFNKEEFLSHLRLKNLNRRNKTNNDFCTTEVVIPNSNINGANEIIEKDGIEFIETANRSLEVEKKQNENYLFIPSKQLAFALKTNPDSLIMKKRSI